MNEATLLDNTPEENKAMLALMELVKSKTLGLRVSDDQQGVEFYCGRLTFPILKAKPSMSVMN